MRLRRYGAIALIVPLAAMGSLVGATSASAEAASTPVVSSVTFSGTQASPTVTISGKGFGAKPTNGVSVSSLPGCSGFNGTDYPNGELWLVDADVPWSAGAYTGANSSSCVGVNIVSWSHHSVVFTFGDGYDTNGWVLTNGDLGAVSAKGAPGYVSVSGLS